MLPESVNVDEMKDTEEKQLLTILKEKGEPFVKKCDGFAVKMDEDKQIEYKDWEDNERTLKVPAGSYVVADCNGCCPKVVTADDFESKNKFMKGDDKPKKKKDNGPKLGIELMGEEID